MNNGYVVGIDLGGTKITGALADNTGNIIYKSTVWTKAYEGEKAVLNRIIKLIEQVINKSHIKKEEVLAIGIGSPGPLDYKKGKIITTPNLPFKDFNIVKYIKDRFNIKVYLDNDANVAALAEYKFGAGRGSNNMIFITVSTGIGAGAILNGKIYRGSTYNALEIGHITVDSHGPLCNCGNYGCVEAISSGTAIANIANDFLKRGKKTSLKKYKVVTCKEVFKEAKNGDALSKDILDNALNYLGICISNIVTIFDPDVVVVGGGISQAGEILFNKINEVVKLRCFRVMSENTKIVPATLGMHAGIIGAIELAKMESLE